MSDRAPVGLHGIVLAAGGARRFGSPKQLAPLHGRTLLQRALAQAQALLGARVSLVLGAHADEIRGTLPPGRRRVLINHQWQRGIAGSIRLAVRHLPDSCRGVLILLADQPQVNRRSLLPLVAAWRQQPRRIIASRYDHVAGAPAIFPRWCFPALASLRGDHGARALIRRCRGRVVCVAHLQAAADVDRPQDLVALAALDSKERVDPGYADQ